MQRKAAQDEFAWAEKIIVDLLYSLAWGHSGDDEDCPACMDYGRAQKELQKRHAMHEKTKADL